MESINLPTHNKDEASHSSQSSHVQKRNRSQLSCASCRHGKLKCDRKQPCSHCLRKGKQCTFSVSTRKPVVSLQNRLKHLESLVKDAMTAQNPGTQRPLSDPLDAPNGNGSASSDANEEQSFTSGQILLSQGLTYVGATHWAAILEDIEEVKTFIGDSFADVEQGHRSSALLWNIRSPLGEAEMLANLPPRLVVDRLISRYFNSASPALFIIHRPTFNKHYRQFWLDPEGTPIIFVGLIYAFIALATLSGLASGETHPDTRGSPSEMLRAYKENCVQCLILSDYTKPTRYTLETMLIYGEAEFLMSRDDQVHSYLLMGVANRLALRMGLHRDSSKVGTNFTPFEAESRRRMWYHINQLDLLASFHIGLPGMMQQVESDTLPPRNLLDEDFDEDCTELPPSRPESEMTPMSYALCKGRLSDVAGEAMILANKLQLPAYEEVLRLDTALHEAYDIVPSQLRLDESQITVTDSPSTILKRFSVSVLFEKSRCMLHRKFLMKAREHPVYQYSKEAGLNASMKLLQRQCLIPQAASSGGPLALDRWFLSSLSIHSFLLAAMIVYLNVMNEIKHSDSGTSTDIQSGLDALEISCSNWEATLSLTPEAERAHLVLVGMVDKVYHALGMQLPLTNKVIAGLKRKSCSQKTSGMLLYSSIDNPATQYHGFDNDEQSSSLNNISLSDTPSSILTVAAGPDMDMQANPFESMLNFSNAFDWELFDTQIRPPLPAIQNTWPDFNTNFEHSMSDDYDYNIQNDTAYQL